MLYLSCNTTYLLCCSGCRDLPQLVLGPFDISEVFVNSCTEVCLMCSECVYLMHTF